MGWWWCSAIPQERRTSISFADFRDGQNARLQSFFSFSFGAGGAVRADSCIAWCRWFADKSLTPQTGPERNWRDMRGSPTSCATGVSAGRRCSVEP